MGYESSLFYAFLFLHLVSLIVGFGAVILMDAVGLLWIRGTISARRLLHVATIAQKVIWTGWIGLILSGPFLLYAKGFIDNLTWIKLFLVAMIGINGVALHFVKKSLHGLVRYESIPPVHKYHIVVASVVSQIGWWGALIIGFMHRHIQHRWDVPSNPALFMFGIAGIWLIAIIIGYLWVRSYHQRHPSRRV